MIRPTALIRRLLILESLQNFLTREIINIKSQMRNQNVKIIDRKDNEQDIWIQYMNGNKLSDVAYMRKMLDAECLGLAKRAGIHGRETD